jgi:hypothetical protein
MKKISIWAKSNIRLARIFIVVLHAILFCLGILEAQLLESINRNLSLPAFGFVVLTIIASLNFYPEKPKASNFHTRRRSYKTQKIFDFALAMCSFATIYVFCTAASNDQADIFPSLILGEARASTGTISTNPERSSSLAPAKTIMISKAERKILKREVFRKWKIWKKENPGHNKYVGLKIFLILVIFAAALVAGYGLAAIACNIQCSGGGVAAANIVLIVGIVAVLAGLFFSIRGVLRIGRKKQEGLDQPAQ